MPSSFPSTVAFFGWPAKNNILTGIWDKLFFTTAVSLSQIGENSTWDSSNAAHQFSFFLN